MMMMKMTYYVLCQQISLSVTEELHIIYFNTVFELKSMSVKLQVESLLLLFVLYE